jgi:DNA repair exonuclease SbcCD ATPase subunit
MKFFDLTFNGTVLPEHDPGQVKLAFARMFSIEDTAELEDIFSGKTIVLRHNLDRKSAAEHFKRIAEIGGKAALIESVESPTGDASPLTTNLDPNLNFHDRVSARSGKHGLSGQIKHSRFREARVEEAESRSNLTEYGDELGRLRTLTSQMKERSRQRYLAIQSRKEAFQRIADQQSAIIEKTTEDSLAKAQSELARIRAQEERSKQNTAAEIDKLEQERVRSTTLSRDKVASLELMKQEAREREQALIANIEARREATKSSAEQEIRRLQQLLLDAQRQAEIDDAQLALELKDTVSNASRDIESLEQQRIQEIDTLEQNIALLLEQQNAVKQRLDEEIANHKQRQQELQDQCQDASSKLNNQLLDIKNKRDSGMAKAEEASRELEAVTRKNLKELYALEMQAKRRHNEALRNYQDPSLPAVELPEITSH